MFGLRSIVAQCVSGGALGLLAVFGPGTPHPVSPYVNVQAEKTVVVQQSAPDNHLNQNALVANDNKSESRHQDTSAGPPSDASAGSDPHDFKALDVTHSIGLRRRWDGPQQRRQLTRLVPLTGGGLCQLLEAPARNNRQTHRRAR